MFNPKTHPGNTDLRFNGNSDHFDMTAPKGASASLALKYGADMIAGGVDWLNNSAAATNRGQALEQYNAMRLGKTSEGVHMHNRLHADMQYGESMQLQHEKENIQKGAAALGGPIGGLLGSYWASKHNSVKDGKADFNTARTGGGVYVNPGDKRFKGDNVLQNYRTLQDKASDKNGNNPLADETLDWLAKQPRSTGTQTYTQTSDKKTQSTEDTTKTLVKDSQSADGISKTFDNTLRMQESNPASKRDQATGEVTTKAQVHSEPTAATTTDTQSTSQTKPSSITGGDEITVDTPYKTDTTV